MKSKLYGHDRFSASNIEDMFSLNVSKSALLGYEERGAIPTASRIMRGKSAYRAWTTLDLPAIGSKLGYLKPPSTPKVVSIFSLKGGTGKSTFAFQFARTLALHGIRTVVVGLDAQETVSQTLNRSSPAPTTADEPPGLYHALQKECDLRDCILKTDLPGLSYIPETVELSVLDRVIKTKIRKEYLIAEQVRAPLLKTGLYDVVIFDCNPAWTDLVTGALSCSDILVSPLGCEINSLKAATIFVDLLAEFQADMRHDFDRFFIVPTLAENNKLSQHVLAKYRIQFDDICTLSSIRRAVVVQESNVLGRALLETASSTQVYQEFISVFREINAAMLDEAAQSLPKINDEAVV